MKKAKRCISAVMAAVMAFTVNASVMAETVSESEMIDINGYSCYERDGQYWTVLDGEEYLVINLDEITWEHAETVSEEEAGISPCSGIVDECPIGTPPLLTEWIYNGYVELNENNDYTYTDRCYLTYGDYYSPIYYFNPRNPWVSFIATIYINETPYIDKYYFDVWKHNSEFEWLSEKYQIYFNYGVRTHILFTASTTQLVDGACFKFSSTGVHYTDFHYTMTLKL